MRIIAMVLGLVMFTSLVFADDITDFKQEQAELQKRLISYQQTLQNIQVRLIELNVLIQYAEKQKIEVKEETK